MKKEERALEPAVERGEAFLQKDASREQGLGLPLAAKPLDVVEGNALRRFHQKTSDEVFELPDVSWPGKLAEPVQGFLFELGRRSRPRLEKHLDELFQVLHSLPEG